MIVCYPNLRRRSNGFTMIEAIMVIVITGIISAMVAVFMKTSIDSYFNAGSRAELTDAADVALRRMAREVRLALPNSVRVIPNSGGMAYLEFIPSSGGGRYRDVDDGSTGGTVLDFTNSANKSFDVLGIMPSPLAAGAGGDYIVVYNLGPGYAPADAYQLANCGVSPGCNIAQVSSIAGKTITLASNRFASETPPMPSPNARFEVVPFATQAVSYSCPTVTAGPLTRYWNYGLVATGQPTTFAGGNSAVAANNVICTVDFSQSALSRNGLLFINLIVQNAAGSEQISVFQQVHVDNSP